MSKQDLAALVRGGTPVAGGAVEAVSGTTTTATEEAKEEKKEQKKEDSESAGGGFGDMFGGSDED